MKLIILTFMILVLSVSPIFAEPPDRERWNDPTATQKLIDPIPFNFDIFNIPRYRLTQQQIGAIKELAALDVEMGKIYIEISGLTIKENNLFIKRLCLLHLKSLDLIRKEKDLKGMRVLLLLMSIMEIEANRTGSFFSNFAMSLKNSDMKTATRMIGVYRSYLISYLETYSDS